ncbi:MAG: GNAT family N-acetyltransferase [Bacteroidales bacterium]
MIITNPQGDDYLKIHELTGKLEGLVQHPVHFYSIICRYFGNSVFIVKEKDEIVGFTWGFISQDDKDIFFLWQIGLDKKYRGRKLAQKLVGRLMDFARDNNCKKIHATVETGNTPSARMFEKMNFRNASHGNTIIENGKKAMVNYYGSGTNQILYEYVL